MIATIAIIIATCIFSCFMGYVLGLDKGRGEGKRIKELMDETGMTGSEKD